jgi:hypothetical protein
MLALLQLHKPDVRLVDSGRGLECSSGPLVRHLLSRQPAQLVVDQREELLGSLSVALLDGGEDSGDLVHRVHPALRGGRSALHLTRRVGDRNYPT